MDLKIVTEIAEAVENWEKADAVYFGYISVYLCDNIKSVNIRFVNTDKNPLTKFEKSMSRKNSGNILRYVKGEIYDDGRRFSYLVDDLIEIMSSFLLAGVQFVKSSDQDYVSVFIEDLKGRKDYGRFYLSKIQGVQLSNRP